MQVLTDRTVTIRASVEDVQFELLLTVALVVMVMFLFLRSVAATVIPSAAVPLSLIGTLAVMYLLGYSLNNLTLMALTISTGFVVDDAIVMIENITRHIELGEKPLQAALKGSAEIGFTIVSLSISLIAALIPLLFMGDIVGRLFREFAVTLSVTIVVSAIVSLTLTPMMCALLLRPASDHKQGRIARALGAGLRGRHRVVRPHAGRRAAPSDSHADRCGVDAGGDRRAVRGDSQGLLPRAGHGRAARRVGGAAGRVVHGDGRGGSRRWRR